MVDRYAITALKAKRAELAGELDELERERQAIKLKLVHIDQSLKLLGFNGNPAEIPSRRSYHREFKRGELQRLAIDIINSSSVPPNNSEIAAEIIRRNGWDVNDGDLLSSMTGKVKVVRRRRMRRQSLALAERAD